MPSLNQLLEHAETELKRLDPVLGEIIQSYTPIRHKPQQDYFISLCQSIVSQQLSTSSAAAIYARLDSETSLVPKNVAKLSLKQIKTIGLSKQKAGYLMDLAQHFMNNPKIYNHLSDSTDQEVIDELTDIKGIGTWTAQMFLMFTLVRLDIFPSADLGIQKAIIRLYKLKLPVSLDQLELFAERWKPYRTVACWYLWQSLENKK